MKLLVLASLLMTVSMNSWSNGLGDSLSSTGAFISAPIVGPIYASTCKNEECYGSLILLPLSTVEAVSTTLIVALKEEVQQVELDAYNFLAGEEMTLALEDFMQELRARHPELNDTEDEAIASLITQLSLR